MFDVDSVRKHFPALAEGAAHFDSPGGSQVAEAVADAVSRTLKSAVANRGRVTRAERRADDIVIAARQAAADLLNADPAGVVFGRSMTQLTYDEAVVRPHPSGRCHRSLEPDRDPTECRRNLRRGASGWGDRVRRRRASDPARPDQRC